MTAHEFGDFDEEDEPTVRMPVVTEEEVLQNARDNDPFASYGTEPLLPANDTMEEEP